MLTEIPIEFLSLQDRGYHIAVRCKVNDYDNLMLLIDTGASNTVFDVDNTAFSHEEKAPLPEEIVSSGFNSEIDKIFIGSIDHVQMGNTQISFDPVLFTSLSHINTVYADIDIENISGILGGDFLKKYSAVIDYEQGILKIKTF